MTVQVNVNSNLQFVRAELERAVEATLESIGLYVTSEAKSRAPVDTNALRTSIRHEVDNSNKIVHIGTPADIDYATAIELGTSKMVAQPFLIPAAQENIANINQLAKSTFEQFGR